MRHKQHSPKLNRNASSRSALLKNLVSQLITHGTITTSISKVKFIQPTLDRIITQSKTDTPHNRRLVARTIKNPKLVQKLFSDIAPGYTDRNSGYTTRTLLGRRRGDRTMMAEVSLIKTTAKPASKPKTESKPKSTQTKKTTTAKAKTTKKTETKKTTAKKTQSKK